MSLYTNLLFVSLRVKDMDFNSRLTQLATNYENKTNINYN